MSPTDQRLAEIRTRLNAATPTPLDYGLGSVTDGDFAEHAMTLEWSAVPYPRRDADGDLFAHAHTDLAWLLAEVERSRAQCWRLLERERTRAAVQDSDDPREAIDLGLP